MSVRDIALLVFVTALWGFNFVAIKVGLQDIPPFLFSALRFILTAFPIIFFIRHPQVPWKYLIAFGIFLGVLKFTLLFKGMDIGVSAGIASLVLQTQAFFTILLAAVLFKELPSAREWSGVFIAFVGIAVIASTYEEFSVVTGLILIVCAGACWAGANLVMKRAGQVNMFRFIVYASIVPPIPLLIFSYGIEGPERMVSAITEMSLEGLLSLLYIVVVAHLFGFAIWGDQLRKHPAAQVAPFSLLVPIFGMVFSALILGEDFGVVKLVGAVAVMAGLVIIFSRQMGILKKA